MSLSDHRRLKVLREAGALERAHNVPHHGSYSVGQHSYDAANIILILHPNPSLNLVKAVLWHDAPERFLGDLPAPAKWYNPALADEYRTAEKTVADHMGIQSVFDELTEEDKHWLSAADRLELLLWAQDQEALGNRHVCNLRDNVLEWFGKNHEIIPEPIKDYMLGNRTWERQREDIR